VAWETIALGLGLGPGPGTPVPAIFLTGSLPKEGSILLPTFLGNYSREAPGLGPQSLLFLPCVCARLYVRVKIWVRLSTWEPGVCLIVEWP
jgi:hypothetical protein